MKRLFDHIDLRVRSLAEAKAFYSAFLPAIGFPDFCETPIGIAYDARRDHPKPEFIGLLVFENFDAVTSPFDAVLITDVLKPRETCEAAVSRFGAERVLVPDLLGVRMRQKSEAAK